MLPFLKWAGGKRWLFTPDFIASLPKHNRYIEPFVGGGAGFFAVQPLRSIISDLNSELICTYHVVRDHPAILVKRLREQQDRHNDEHYYRVRDTEPSSDIERAVRFLYLNRTCWNGLYRVNKSGKFNVPKGTKSSILLDSDDFYGASALLKQAEILNCDFERVIDFAGEGDLVFVDPPYTVKHNMNGFVKYNENIFSWSDQIRLRDSLVRATGRGARIVMTNADHTSIHEIYGTLFAQSQVKRASIISGESKGRSAVTEILVTN